MTYKKYFSLLSIIAMLLCGSYSYATSNDINDQAECVKDPNRFWDSSLNRCMVTEQAIETRSDYEECASKEDKTEQSKCLKALAEKETGHISTPKGKSDTSATVINTALGGSVALAHLFSERKGKTACTSLMLAAGTGMASVLGQTLYIKDAKKKVDDIRSRYEKATSSESEDPYATQLQAFQYLKEEQEAVAELAKKRKTMYYLYAAGYGSAIAMVVSDWNKPSCGGTPSSETGADSTAENATSTPEGTDATNAEQLKGMDLVKAKAELLATPPGVATVAALGVTWNYYLGSQAAKQEKAAKKNAKEIQAVIDKFQTNVAGLCPEGREDMGNARCFCYTADNEKHPERNNSQICQQLWAQDDKNFYVDNKGLAANSTSSNTKACIANNGQVDSSCQCRNYVDENGNDACQKVSLAPTNLNSLAASMGTGGTISNLNGLTNGNLGLGNLDSEQVTSAAIKAKQNTDKVIKKLNSTLPKGQKINLNGKAQRGFAKVLGTKKSNLEAANFKKANALVSKRPQSNAISDALKKVEKKVSLSKVNYSSTNKNSFKRKAPNFNFDAAPSGSNSKVGKFAAKEEYDYKENDIVNREEASIWEVMSHRYQVSGLKRLFPDE